MKSTKPNICALILAGGLASRMGYQDKGLLPIQGHSFVEHLAKQLENQVNQIIISSNTNQLAYQKLGFQCINDSPFPSEGPLCAIAAGLEKISCDYLLIIPCDSPNISETLVEQLFSAMQATKADIASLKRKDKIEPLFSLINTKLAETLTEKITRGLRKTQDWIVNENHVLVVDDSLDKYFNINTAEQLNNFLNNKFS